MLPPRHFLQGLLALVAYACLATPLLQAQAPAPVGTTRVAQWKDDKKAAFLLMFDDSWPSHWQVAAPEIAKRGLTATFYICPAKGEHQKFAKEWNEKVWKMGMAYGNHTMTHKGVKDVEHAEYEVGECARVIRQIIGAPEDALVSYGQPGVPQGTWNISSEELESLLVKHHMISRPPFTGHGAVYHIKTLPEMIALADKAVAKGGMEYLVVHGVERIAPNWGYQDMWPLKQEIFFPFLDDLKAKSDRGDLWVTDHISQHQYETERSTAEVKSLPSPAGTLQFTLQCKADAKFYNLPLTLVTTVPSTWKSALVTQGERKTTVPVQNGVARYDALPGAMPIRLQSVP
jgi:hypothetical protein